MKRRVVGPVHFATLGGLAAPASKLPVYSGGLRGVDGGGSTNVLEIQFWYRSIHTAGPVLVDVDGVDGLTRGCCLAV